MIEIQKLNVRYNKTTIISNLSLQLNSHLVIIGSNGSGKSTLAKALSGLIPYKGSITLEGRELKELEAKERAKNINYIPSKLESFDKFTTLKEFLELSRYAHGTLFKHDDATVLIKEKLDFLNITHLQDKRLQELSSGQQQLALIASALVQESKIIIFDEPTANLDPENSVEFYKHLKLLQKSHQIILITHDLNLASKIKSSLLYMQKDSTHFFETTDDFFTNENLEKFYHGSVKQTEGVGEVYV